MRALGMFLEKCFLVLLTFIETDRPSSVPGSRVTLMKHFAFKRGLSLTHPRGNLLVCKQGLKKLQIPFSVLPLTLVKTLILRPFQLQQK